MSAINTQFNLATESNAGRAQLAGDLQNKWDLSVQGEKVGLDQAVTHLSNWYECPRILLGCLEGTQKYLKETPINGQISVLRNAPKLKSKLYTVLTPSSAFSKNLDSMNPIFDNGPLSLVQQMVELVKYLGEALGDNSIGNAIGQNPKAILTVIAILVAVTSHKLLYAGRRAPPAEVLLPQLVGALPLPNADDPVIVAVATNIRDAAHARVLPPHEPDLDPEFEEIINGARERLKILLIALLLRDP